MSVNVPRVEAEEGSGPWIEESLFLFPLSFFLRPLFIFSLGTLLDRNIEARVIHAGRESTPADKIRYENATEAQAIDAAGMVGSEIGEWKGRLSFDGGVWRTLRQGGRRLLHGRRSSLILDSSASDLVISLCPVINVDSPVDLHVIPAPCPF